MYCTEEEEEIVVKYMTNEKLLLGTRPFVLGQQGFKKSLQSACAFNLSSGLVKTLKSLGLGEKFFQRCRLFVQDLKEDCQLMRKQREPKCSH